MIAALYVERDGVYAGLPDVDVWDIDRDARTYAGPWPVVCHPPCERWGRYWSGGPSATYRRQLGADDGCFASALSSVRTLGGVLEHPEASHAFRVFSLGRPRPGSWQLSDDGLGWITQVEQGRYGHPARKKTWLYARGPIPWLSMRGGARGGGARGARDDVSWLPRLDWKQSAGVRLDEGFHSKAERDAARAAGVQPRKRLSKAQNVATPIPFRDVLLDLARSVRRRAA